jgi:NitT/TauT family transport system permease protein
VKRAGAAGKKTAKRQRGERRTFAADLVLRLACILALLAAWQTIHYFMVTLPGDAVRGALFPAPAQVGRWLWQGFGFSYFSGAYSTVPGVAPPQNFWQAFARADFPPNILASVWRLIQGYLLSLLIGFPLGLLVARSMIAEKTIGWLALSLQAMPSIGWAPIAILWFGDQSTAPILFVTVAGSLFATILAVSDSIRQVPPSLARAGRTLGATGARLYLGVLLPAALPTILTGLKVGWSFAWRSLLAAELLVSAGGLGQLLQRHKTDQQAAGLLATIFVIILISLGVQSLIFAPIERRLRLLWGLTGVRS